MEVVNAACARRGCRAGALASAVAGLVILTAPAAQTSAQTTASTKASAPTVLFLCPHGAAKSVLASAYFQQIAKERGLNVRVESAGTDPDPAVAPAVATHLTKKGYPVPVSKPRRVTDADLATADVVISIGCDLTNVATPRGTLQKWDDVPAPSEDFDAAEQRIRERVIALVDELLRKQHR